ncbi:uncharacterized protein KD926_004728 [Aspergillus affinis]|uniref:uncharacterized protein n=1 Tax=Aspergillus affinis TaxID=1070780 RepID=UPI0022FF31A3|nr:uncharacterized protein KD926_004728 [Aspergillus affinis]KAI9042937.1 hypothetical protein KD926_004728 [Aspergillus affinis]
MSTSKYIQLSSNTEEEYAPSEDSSILISRLKSKEQKQSQLLVFQWVTLAIISLTSLGLLLAGNPLHEISLSKIPRSSAAQLVDKTVPIPDYPGEYANMIRLKVWSAESPTYVNHTLDTEMFEISHIDHCIDSVRQSVMCHSDIAPIPWTWDEKSGSAKGKLTGHHTCRDFEAIRQWAREHHAERFDRNTFVEDPLGNQ